MKSKPIFVGILGLALVFGLFCIACEGPGSTDNPGDSEVYFKLTYNANGGSGKVPATQTGKEGTGVTVASQGDLYFDGYVFAGWRTEDTVFPDAPVPSGGYFFSPGAEIPLFTNITLYAIWDEEVKQEQFTLTYNANGASGTVPAAQTGDFGTTITIAEPNNLTYPGKTFIGWSTSVSGSGNVFYPNSIIDLTSNITLYAIWESSTPAQYTVTYNANGASGTVPATQTVDSGGTVTVAGQGSLTYIGKTFSGWNTNAAGTETAHAANSSLTINGNITLYAQWTTNQYTVTYNANGANGTVPDMQTVNSGGTVTVAGQGGLTYPGKTFGGWNTNAAGTGTAYAANDSLTVNANVTLYAQWTTLQQYTVTYNANGASGTAPASQTVDSGGTVTVAGQGGLTFTGKAFSGWNIDAAGIGTAHAANSSLTVNANVTLYAQWTTNQYTVTYNANGASGTVPAAQTEDYGTAVTVAGQGGLTNTGKVFGGWNTSAAGTGIAYAENDSLTVNADVTLYAQWATIQYTVTFSANEGAGTAPGTVTVDTGTGITLPAGTGLSRDEYTFDGWNTQADGAGTNYNAGASYTVTGNITLYAKWLHYTGATVINYWVNEQDEIATSSKAETVLSQAREEELVITASDAGYTNQKWYLNGVEVTENAGQSSYTFSSTENQIKKFTISLLVEKDGSYYNTTFTVTVRK